MKNLFLSICALFFSVVLFGQTTLTLQQCIETAWAQNLGIKAAELNLEMSEQELLSARADFLPSVNGFASHNYNWGQRIDPFTNEFANARVQSNSFGLSSDVVLFEGFRNQNSVKQQKKGIEQSKYDLQRQKNDIALTISSAYLNILQSQELEAVAVRQRGVTAQQVDQTEKMFKAGAVSEAELLDLQAQLYREEAAIVSARNSVRLAMLTLKQLLLMPAETEIAIVKPGSDAFSADVQLESATVIYAMAESSMPEIKSAEAAFEGSALGMEVAKGGRMPRLALSGSIGTGYSGLRTEVISVAPDGQSEIGFTETGETVFQPTFDIQLKKQAFGSQLNDNFNQFLGVSLSVPVFNGLNTTTAITRAKVNMELAELQVSQEKLDLRQRIESAHADALAARESYVASERALVASQRASDFAKARFEAGAINAADLNLIKNNLLVAQSDMLRAKYDFAFRKAILDFYMGNPINLQ